MLSSVALPNPAGSTEGFVPQQQAATRRLEYGVSWRACQERVLIGRIAGLVRKPWSQLQKCSLAALGWEGYVKKRWKYSKLNTAEGDCATFQNSFAIGSLLIPLLCHKKSLFCTRSGR